MLTRVNPESITYMTDEELEFFTRACDTYDRSGSPMIISSQILGGFKDLWKWETEDSLGIIITSRIVHSDGSVEMLVQMMAGRNFIAHYKEITLSLMHEAFKMGANGLVAWVKPDLWDKFNSLGVDYDKAYVVVRYPKINRYDDQEDSE